MGQPPPVAFDHGVGCLAAVNEKRARRAGREMTSVGPVSEAPADEAPKKDAPINHCQRQNCTQWDNPFNPGTF